MSFPEPDLPIANMETLMSQLTTAKPNTRITGSPIGGAGGGSGFAQLTVGGGVESPSIEDR